MAKKDVDTFIAALREGANPDVKPDYLTDAEYQKALKVEDKRLAAALSEKAGA